MNHLSKIVLMIAVTAVFCIATECRMEGRSVICENITSDCSLNDTIIDGNSIKKAFFNIDEKGAYASLSFKNGYKAFYFAFDDSTTIELRDRFRKRIKKEINWEFNRENVVNFYLCITNQLP